eukprot:5170634-Prymnesium_polylepis.1
MVSPRCHPSHAEARIPTPWTPRRRRPTLTPPRPRGRGTSRGQRRLSKQHAHTVLVPGHATKAVPKVRPPPTATPPSQARGTNSKRTAVQRKTPRRPTGYP